jgi:microcystin-dependent protein
VLCDGRQLSRVAPYQQLYDFLGGRWGSAGVGLRAVPDLRGLFLRGVDNSPATGSSTRDPDRDSRIPSAPGGQPGNAVGSFQPSEIQAHQHEALDVAISQTYEVLPGGGSGLFVVAFGPKVFVNNAPPTKFSGRLETRPQNAYVNYIIKY